MPLTFTVLRCPDSVPPETRTITGGEFTVGRGPGVDWVLPDPERLLSKHHFAVAYRGGSWQIADTSTNGTIMNRDPAPIGQAEVRVLRDGDRLSLGSYEIEIRVAEDAMPQAGLGGFGAGFGAAPPSRGNSSPFGDPFAMDPLAPPPAARHPFDEPPQAGFGLPTAAQLPSDFDPLAPEPGNSAFLGPTRSDHSPVLDDAFRPPATTGHMPLHGGGALPGDSLLPDDWDKDLLEGINGQSASPQAAPHTPAQPFPQPFGQPVGQPFGQTGSQPFTQPAAMPFPQSAGQALPHSAGQAYPQSAGQPFSQPNAQPFTPSGGQPFPQSVRPQSADQAFAPPAAQPFANPPAEPYPQSVGQPFGQPPAQPFAQPAAQPFPQPAAQPFPQSAAQPPQQSPSPHIADPSDQVFAQPAAQAFAPSTAQPFQQSAAQPFQQPAAQPLQQPAQPFQQPATRPFTQPVVQPVTPPTAHPSGEPFAQPPASSFAQPMVQPVTQPFTPSNTPPTARPPDLDPFAEPEAATPAWQPAAEHHPVAPAAPRPTSPFDEPFDLEPVPPPLVAQPTAGIPTPTPGTAAASASEGALLAAFLQGVRMTDVQPGDPAAMMRSLGEAFRTLVSGLRAVLIARASIKSEFRIEQTMIRARGNNPLKFSAGDDDALAALLGTGRRTDMTPAAAVADALKDIRLHELASMAAMQAAVRHMLEGLDPAKLRAQADLGGGMSVLPAQKKARAWDAFEALHTRTVQALSDDFDSVFGKAFARAYERALDEVTARER